MAKRKRNITRAVGVRAIRVSGLQPLAKRTVSSLPVNFTSNPASRAMRLASAIATLIRTNYSLLPELRFGPPPPPPVTWLALRYDVTPTLHVG